jgi:hypothetical protein
LTVWRIPVSQERCWAEIDAFLRPGAGAWWPGLRVESAPRELASGGTVVLVVRSPVGYRLRAQLVLTTVTPPAALVAESAGDLRGSGAVALQAVAGGTELRFQWEVDVRRRWMRVGSAVLRPVFVAAHNTVMRRGERAFRKRVSDAPGELRVRRTEPRPDADPTTVDSRPREEP